MVVFSVLISAVIVGVESLFTTPVAGAVTLALLGLVVVRVAVDFVTVGFVVVAVETVGLGGTDF